MSFEYWLAFTATSVVLLAIPGPTVLLIVSYALTYGRRAAGATIAGVALGDFTAMTASMLGLGVLLASSATLFMAVKWLGAAYLVYLGYKLWRAPVASNERDAALHAAPKARPLRIFGHVYAVTALNPKGIVFFVAFLPQFIDASQPVMPQILLYEVTFLVLATLNALIYGLLASVARTAIRKPTVQRTVNRAGGSLMIGAGALTALWSRG